MTRALIVIDVQNEYLTGNLPISYPDPAVSLPNIARAMDAAAELGIPVVVVQHCTPPGAPIFADGSPGWELHESVASRPRDLLVSKTFASCFVGTGLADWIAENGIDTVTIVGYMTQNCDESTARDASHRGLSAEVLSDATGTLDFANRAGTVSARTLHETVLITLESNFAAVVTTDEWIRAVRAGETLIPSSVYASTEGARGN